jgi:hypothetical protein
VYYSKSAWDLIREVKTSGRMLKQKRCRGVASVEASSRDLGDILGEVLAMIEALDRK